MKVLFYLLISATTLVTNAQQIIAQLPLQDSISRVLTQFQKKTKDKKLTEALHVAQNRLAKNDINDSLARKLLAVYDLLIDSSDPDYQSVQSYIEKTTRLLRKLSPQAEHPDYLKSLYNLGFVHESLGNYQEALSIYREILAIRKRIGGIANLEYAKSLNALANLYERMGEYMLALSNVEEARRIIKKISGVENADYALSLNILGTLYDDLGQYDKMQPVAQQALLIRKKVLGENDPAYAESVGMLANLYESLGQYDAALELYKMDSAISRKTLGVEHPDYAYSLNNLAFVYEDLGRYDKALPLYQQALAIRKKVLGEGHPYYGISLNNLAGIYRSLGQYEQALRLYKKDSIIIRKTLGEKHTDFALNLNNLADVYQRMGKYQQARPLIEQAMIIQKNVTGEENHFYLSYLNTLSALNFKLGRFGKALENLQQKYEISRRLFGEQHPEFAASLNALANYYQSIGKYDTALELCEKALVLYKKNVEELHPDFVNCLYLSGLLHTELGDESKGATLLNQASALKLRYLNQTYSSLSEQEKIGLLQMELLHFAYLPSLLMSDPANFPDLARQEYTNELLLKGMVLENQKGILETIRDTKDSSTLQMYLQWRFNKAFLGKQVLLALDKRVSYFDSLQQATNTLEQQLSRNVSAFHNQLEMKSTTVADIGGELNTDEACIEFVRFSYYKNRWTDSIIYAALLLLPGGSTIKFIALFEEKQLQNLLEHASKNKTDFQQINTLYGYSKRNLNLGDSLFKLVWQPLEKYLSGINTISYAPTGLLHNIAFQALRRDSTHFLIDRYHLHQMLSTRSVVTQEPFISSPSSVSVWGNIDYNRGSPSSRNRNNEITNAPPPAFGVYSSGTRSWRGNGWDPLPGTKQEMENIKKIFLLAGVHINSISGRKATERTFKALDGHSPKVIHLATHGFFMPTIQKKPKEFTGLTNSNPFTIQENPMFRSGLVLAGGNRAWNGKAIPKNSEDGILTAYEISQMNFSNTFLVVLSACTSGLGDIQGNEGVMGLQRAFKLAGVKQMLVSLWPVPDRQTVELMTLFYKSWLEGLSTREALRQAQLCMKEKYPPYFWAAFTLVE